MEPIRLQPGAVGDAKDDMPSLRFDPIERIHEGPGYRSYRALDRHRNQVVVVSSSCGDRRRSDEVLSTADFLAMGNALRDARSVGLPQPVQFGFFGDRAFVAHEAIDGCSLGALAPAQKGARTAVAVGLWISRGLRPLHKIGRGHGSVAIPSIAVRPEGQVLLTELGLLRTWAAPIDAQPDPADDIMALGRLLLLLASTGERKDPELQEPLRALIGRMTAARPEDRPTLDGVDEVLEDLNTRFAAPRARFVPSAAHLPRKRRGGRLVGFGSNPGAPVPTGPSLVEAPRPRVVVPMSESHLQKMVGGRMAGFINTVSICSAKWWVGKEHGPWVAKLGMTVPPPRKEGPTPVQRVSLVLPLLLLAAVSLLWWDRSEPPLQEPSLMASLAQIAPERSEPVIVDEEPEVAEAEMPAAPEGEPRVVRYRDGKPVAATGEAVEDRLATLEPVTPYRQPIRPAR